MATLGHVAIGLAAGRLHSPRTSAAAMAAFSALSLLPDADVVAFKLGIPYSAPFGHRGAAHSLVAALLVGAIIAAGCRFLGRPALKTGLMALAVVASHGLLDAFTDGGLGIALGWPLTNARTFAAWTPIPVAPIGPGMLSARGLHVLAVEALFFLPVFLWALWPRGRHPGPTRKGPMSQPRSLAGVAYARSPIPPSPWS
ncbi:MAG: metal-dependent hydrolase [Myxococcaceae bacterium]